MDTSLAAYENNQSLNSSTAKLELRTCWFTATPVFLSMVEKENARVTLALALGAKAESADVDKALPVEAEAKDAPAVFTGIASVEEEGMSLSFGAFTDAVASFAASTFVGAELAVTLFDAGLAATLLTADFFAFFNFFL